MDRSIHAHARLWSELPDGCLLKIFKFECSTGRITGQVNSLSEAYQFWGNYSVVETRRVGNNIPLWYNRSMDFSGVSAPYTPAKAQHKASFRFFTRNLILASILRRSFWLYFLVMAGAACAQAPSPAETPSPSPTLPLTLYLSPAPSVSAGKTRPAPVATLTPRPSPTPFTYTIVEEDTLLTIAFRFGVTVDEIMAVNPGINPRILSIGTTVIIPLGEEGEASIPTATPVPLLVGAARCYRTAAAGLWCFIPVLNELPVGVAGVTGEISIYHPTGELYASVPVLPPLDVIPPRKVLPLYANFSPPIPEGYFVRGRVTGAFLAAGGEDRGLLAQVVDLSLEALETGGVAGVQGQVVVGEEGEGEPALIGTLLVVAVAYSDRNEVVGLRLWEQKVEAEPGDRYPFEIQVYSLGPPIAEVEVFAEWRADPPAR